MSTPSTASTAHPHAHAHAGDWASDARLTLQRAGHHKGAAREALIELLSVQRCALSAQEIESRLQQSGAAERPPARASIYRALELLHELGLITRIEVGDGLARYEPASATGDHHHHHLVCDRCGALVPFDDPSLESAIDKLCERVDFTVKEHEVTLHGVCAGCKPA